MTTARAALAELVACHDNGLLMRYGDDRGDAAWAAARKALEESTAAPADDLVANLRLATELGEGSIFAKAADVIESLQAEVARLTMSDESVPREREYWIGQLLSGTPAVAASRAIDLLMSQSRKIAALHNARNGRAEAAEQNAKRAHKELAALQQDIAEATGHIVLQPVEPGTDLSRVLAANAELSRRAAAAEADAARLRAWLDNNTTFYNVDADWPVEGPNIPVLAQVTNRIWYHATDDVDSYPFSAVADAARADAAKAGDPVK